MRPPAFSDGFTLVEMLVVVALMSLLATIAVPSYLSHVRNGNRASAMAFLNDCSQRMERYYTQNNNYDVALTTVCPIPASLTAYTVALTTSGGTPSTGYTLTATPTARQAADTCGALSLSSTGARTAAKGICW